MPASEEAAPLTDQELLSIPVFPLPSVVLFPNGILPLHLFEERYRDMIRDCLKDGPEAIVMAQPGVPKARESFADPPLRPVGCAGRIVAHEELDDGRHNIVLRGMTRVELSELPRDKAYRRAAASVVRDGGRSVAQGDLTALLSCATGVSALVRRAHPEFSLGLGEGLAPGQLADAIADRLLSDISVRQTVLECLNPEDRVRLVTDHVSELLAMLTRSSDPGELQ